MMSLYSIDEAFERLNDPNRKESVAEVLAQLSDVDKAIVMDGLDLGDLEYDWNFWARPVQLIPEKPYYNMHLFLAGRGSGKLLDVETPVPMADGTWKNHGNLLPGDLILDEEGQPTEVLHVHPVRTPEKCYRLWFTDGTYLDAGAEHMWNTWTHYARKAFGRKDRLWTQDTTLGYPTGWPTWRTPHYPWRRESEHDGPRERSTQEIVNTFRQGKRGDLNHSIPLVKPIPYSEKEHIVPAELLGWFLGDGTTNTGDITAHVLDAVYVQSLFKSYGYYDICVRHSHDNTMQLKSAQFRKDLKQIGVIGHKHIPLQYLTGSIEQRKKLLAGLLGSDGYIDSRRSCVEFCSVIPELADNTAQLIRSLGEKPVVKWSEAKLYGVRKKDRCRITWRPKFNPFGMEWKQNGYRELGAQSIKHYHRMITRFEEIEPVPMNCITVDSPHALYLAGEGFIPTRNTRTMTEDARKFAMQYPGIRLGFLGRSAADTRDVLVNGQSGVLNIPQPESERPVYKSVEAKVIWPNGSQAKLMSAEAPDAVRGGEYERSYVDELAAHTPITDGAGLTAFQNLRLATRIGEHPSLVVATTPKRVQILRDLIEESEDPKKSIRIMRGSTMDNKSNLAEAYLSVILGQYAGTELAEQELMGEMLDEAPEGALWSENTIRYTGLTESQARRLPLRVVGVDPSVADKPTDLCGIVVMGATNGPLHKRKAVVLEDASLQASPEIWARQVVKTIKKWNAWGAVVESNQGGELLKMALHNVDPTVRVALVYASKSKKLRAEPVSQVYEQGRIKHLQRFSDMETQMTSWDPSNSKKSPDRVDALVHAGNALLIKPPKELKARRLRPVRSKGYIP